MRHLPLLTKLMQTQRWDEACAVAEQAMLAHPSASLWPLLCSQAHAAAGRPSEAVSFAGRAQELEENLPAQGREAMAAMWYSAGLAAFLQNDHTLAFSALEQAHSLEPDNPDIALHLALAAQNTHQYETAIELYRHFLTHAPKDNQARFNLFSCLLATDDLNEAQTLADIWSTDVPLPVEALLAQASLLLARKDYHHGLALLEHPINRLYPQVSAEQTALFHTLRGRCLRGLEHHEQAAAEFSTALESAPASTSATSELLMALQAEGKLKEAAAVLQKFARNNGPDPLLEAKQALHFPAILQSAREADDIRRNVKAFLECFHDAPLLGRPMEIMSSPPFFLAFHNRNDKELLRRIAQFLIRHSTVDAGSLGQSGRPGLGEVNGAGAFSRRPDCLPPCDRRRVGFISRHFTNHTIMSYFFRMLRELCPRIPHCFILEFPQKDNPFRRELAQKASMVTLPDRLGAAIHAVRELNLDILVYLDLGMDPLTWFLAFSRLATVQCALYGHPMTTGIPNIDIFISPDAMEPDNAGEHYTESLHRLPGLLCSVLPPPPPLRTSPRAASGNVYLCAQSLFKVHPDLDAVMLHILSRDNDAEIHFFQSRLQHETRALQTRFRYTLPEHHTRIRWLPQCSEQEFLGLLQDADVILDTPHFSGGSTSFKALGIGAPVITMEGAFMRGRQTSGLYRYLGVKGLTAGTLEELGELALHIAHSPSLRRDKSREIFALKDRLFSLDAADHLEHFLMHL